MANNQENPKVLKSKYVPTAEFYSQIIDSLQDYSIFYFRQRIQYQ
jgi:two-component system CheB/CheR fusion protein